MKLLLIALAPVAGFALDLLLGDPQSRYHPVCLIGRYISHVESVLRRQFPATDRGERAAGVVLAISVPLTVWVVAAAVTLLCVWLNIWLGFVVEAVLTWLLLATKSLQVEGVQVRNALEHNRVDEARRNLSRIVGRDTQQLSKDRVICATVETIAENTTDAIVAPLFFTALGGASFGWFYKAVNTLDSMVGYRNKQYLNFGRASARLDDALNFFPSRMAALCMIAAAGLNRMDRKQSYQIWRRDRFNHPSPNSAQTEAVCAGALGLQLAGPMHYAGIRHEKPFIGNPNREPCPEDISRANRLMLSTSWLSLVILSLCRVFLYMQILF